MNHKQEIFRLTNLSYSYHSISALENISFSILKGEKIALLGANGSGKSTILRILDALLFPTLGHLTAFGKRIDSKYMENEKNEYEFRQKVGYVFQDSDVQLFSSTVWDEVTFAPLQLGLSRDEVFKKSLDALKIMGIESLKERVPYQLSGGEKKKVAIASILSYSPEVWIFDEPTAGLDPRSQSRLIDFMYDMHSKKKTIVTATHDLTILEEIADRVLVISEDHKLVADSTPQKILSNPAFLKKHNLIHEHTHAHDRKKHQHAHIHKTSHKH